MKITEILLQKFWPKNEKGRKALLNAIRMGLINNNLDIEGDDIAVIEKWSRWVKFLYSQCLLKQAAQEKGVLPFDHTILTKKNQQYLLGDHYIKGLKQLIDPVVKCLATEITTIDENIAHILKLGETEGNNQIVSGYNSKDEKEERKETKLARPEEFPGLLKLIEVLNSFNSDSSNRKSKKIDPNDSCIFYNNNYEILPTKYCLKFALNPENYDFENYKFVQREIYDNDESNSINSFEEDEEEENEYFWGNEEGEDEEGEDENFGEEESEEGEAKYLVNKTPRSDTTVSSKKPTPGKSTLHRKLTPNKSIIDTDEKELPPSNINSRISRPGKKNRDSRYYSQHTSTTASQKNRTKPGKKIPCQQYFSELTELSKSQNIRNNFEDNTEDDFSIFNNSESNFFQDDNNGKNKDFEDGDLNLIDLRDKKSTKKPSKDKNNKPQEMEEENIYGSDSIESENDSNEIRLDIKNVDPNVPRLDLSGTNLAEFNGKYSTHGTLHRTKDMPNIDGVELAGYFSPLTVKLAQEIQSATRQQSNRLQFKSIQNHPFRWLTGGTSIITAGIAAFAGGQPWKKAVHDYAFNFSNSTYYQLGTDIVDANTQFLEEQILANRRFLTVELGLGLLLVYILIIVYLSQKPVIKYYELPVNEKEHTLIEEQNDLNPKKKPKQSIKEIVKQIMPKKVSKYFEEDKPLIENEESNEGQHLLKSNKYHVKYSNRNDEQKCQLAYVTTEDGEHWLVRLQDNFLTSNNQPNVLKKQDEKISKQNEKLAKRLNSQEKLLGMCQGK